MNKSEFSARIGDAVSIANVPTLLMVLVQLTGDLRWIESPFTPSRGRGLDDNDSGGLPEDVIATVRAAAQEEMVKWFETGRVALPHPGDELLVRMLSVAMGEPVPIEYAPIITQDLYSPANTTFPFEPPEKIDAPADFNAVVIGAGMSGILAGYRLKEAGIPFTICEKARTVGGTWRDNRYPAAGVDSPNHVYSFSFAPFNWTKYFALRDELQAYLEYLVDHLGLRDNLRLSTEVRSACYDQKAGRWNVEAVGPAGSETLNAKIVISASGLFNPPKLPDIAGLDSFAGTLVHTAQWPDKIDLAGKRVGVIGNGASAMQTVPAIADQVASLTIFQRSRQWAAPFAKFQVELPEALRFMFDAVPLYRTWYRIRLGWTYNDRLHDSFHKDPNWTNPDQSINATNQAHREYFERYILKEIGDREDLKDKVIPPYPPYGKRILMDNGWFRTLARPHVHLVEEPIASIEPQGVRTASGALHEFDVLILATGFDVQRFLSTFDLVGRDGKHLRDIWGEDNASAYMGSVIPGFPNFFCLYGPNTQPGHGGSILLTLEAQMNYIMSVLTQMAEQRISSIECRRDVHDKYNEEIRVAHEDLIWTHPGMQTYYRNREGRVTVNSPFRNLDFWKMTRSAKLDDYVVEKSECEAVSS